MRKQIIFVCLMTLYVSLCFGLDDCGSKIGELVKITVTGCADLEERCILHRSSNVTLTMEFNTKQKVKEVTSIVYGVVLGVPIRFNLPNSDACKDSGLTCPLAAGGPFTYIATLPVEKKYPKVTVDVKWELQDENSNNILCILIPSKIQ